MKFSDALAELFAAFDVENFFAVTGGAAVHLIDSFERSGLNGTFNHHEQASALAADAHTRLGRPAICATTTGPGVTNALTGLLCSWQDSVPVIYVSGQSRTANIGIGYKVRQSGTQHLNVGPVVESMTKEFLLATQAQGALQKVAKLLNLSRSGRKGPVWLDIPLDVQLQDVSDSDLVEAIALLKDQKIGVEVGLSETIASALAEKLAASANPVLLLGSGTKYCDPEQVKRLIAQGIPFVTTWGLAGAAIEQDSRWLGRVGVSGMRGANLAMMNSDLLLVIGARLGQSVAGANLADLAPASEIIVCDIDSEELRLLQDKLPRAQLFEVDSNALIASLVNNEKFTNLSFNQRLVAQSLLYQKINHDEYVQAAHTARRFDLYGFLLSLNVAIHKSSQAMNIVVDGGGNVVYSTMQTLQSRDLLDIIIPAASAPMGTGLPHALGAWVANSRSTLLLVGDGSFPFNVQELHNLKALGANLKIFVLENEGYRSIRSTQEAFLNSRYLGSIESGGLYLPKISKIALGYDIDYRKLEPEISIGEIQDLIEKDGVQIIEVPIRLDQQIYPRVAFEEIPGSNAKKALPLDKMDPHKPPTVNLKNIQVE